MPLKRCPRSGVLYDSKHGPVHPDCMEQEEADYDRVLDYLRDHPHAPPAAVAEALSVNPDVLGRMVEQGLIRPLSDSEVEKHRKRLSEKELQHLNAKVTEQIASIKLPEKKKVEIDGTVRNMLQKKRNIE